MALTSPVPLRWSPSTVLELSLIEQAPQPLHRRLHGPGEAVLRAPQPVDLGLGEITPELRLAEHSSPAVLAL